MNTMQRPARSEVTAEVEADVVPEFVERLRFDGIEASLEKAVASAAGDSCPPRLRGAIKHAVFPGGGRLRPKLLIAVAATCGAAPSELVSASAASIELLHCASLVHDDLPCFDDAATRRGLPSVQHAYGEAAAVLAGDALIVLAFETLLTAAAAAPHALAPLTRLLAESAGARRGLVAGQGWELETSAPLATYHRAKTGSLFEAAAAAGAIVAGQCPQTIERWAAFGRALGEAYQLADDVADASGDASDLGKPIARDAALARPSIVRELGLARARVHGARRFEAALDAIPSCANASSLRAWTIAEVARTKVGSASRAQP